jgi:hypothetical protein
MFVVSKPWEIFPSKLNVLSQLYYTDSTAHIRNNVEMTTVSFVGAALVVCDVRIAGGGGAVLKEGEED